MNMPPRDAKYMLLAIACLVLLAGTGALLLPQQRAIIAGITSFGVALAAGNLWLFKIPIFPYDRILSAVSDCDGLEWTREVGVRIDVGGIHGSCQVYYPKVVELDIGFRLYYRAGGYDAHIASAFSSDGIAWREELGVRIGSTLELSFRRIEGCEVLGNEDDGWSMFFSATDGRYWRLYRSDSADGLQWSAGTLCLDASQDRALPNLKAPSIVTVASGLRMYFMRFSADDLEIGTSFSADGEEWGEVQSCIGLSPNAKILRNPCVRPAIDGKLRMYFAQRSADNRPLGGRIVSAVSEDGICWQREAGVRLGPGRNWDRHGVFSVDPLEYSGGWRMYYSGYWGRHLLEPFTLWQHRQRARRHGADLSRFG